VKTTTGVPPPWGFREMLKILTPTVAQSLAGSSLTIIESWPVRVPELLLEELLFPPQPESTKVRATRNPTSARVSLEFIEFSLGACAGRSLPLLLFVMVRLMGTGPTFGRQDFAQSQNKTHGLEDSCAG
jgi:hypothetical protein